MNKYILGLCAALMLIVVAQMYQVKGLGDNVTRLSDNQSILFKGVTHSIDSLTATTGQLTLSTSELSLAVPSLKKDISKLGIRIGQVESVSRTGLNVSARLMAQVLDSISGNDTLLVSRYRDSFIKFESILNKKDTVSPVKIDIPIKLQQIVNRYKEGFWMWKPFRNWKFKQTITSDNPYAKITYDEYIVVKR